MGRRGSQRPSHFGNPFREALSKKGRPSCVVALAEVVLAVQADGRHRCLPRLCGDVSLHGGRWVAPRDGVGRHERPDFAHPSKLESRCRGRNSRARANQLSTAGAPVLSGNRGVTAAPVVEHGPPVPRSCFFCSGSLASCAGCCFTRQQPTTETTANTREHQRSWRGSILESSGSRRTLRFDASNRRDRAQSSGRTSPRRDATTPATEYRLPDVFVRARHAPGAGLSGLRQRGIGDARP